MLTGEVLALFPGLELIAPSSQLGGAFEHDPVPGWTTTLIEAIAVEARGGETVKLAEQLVSMTKHVTESNAVRFEHPVPVRLRLSVVLTGTIGEIDIGPISELVPVGWPAQVSVKAS